MITKLELNNARRDVIAYLEDYVDKNGEVDFIDRMLDTPYMKSGVTYREEFSENGEYSSNYGDVRDAVQFIQGCIECTDLRFKDVERLFTLNDVYGKEESVIVTGLFREKSYRRTLYIEYVVDDEYKSDLLLRKPLRIDEMPLDDLYELTLNLLSK